MISKIEFETQTVGAEIGKVVDGLNKALSNGQKSFKYVPKSNTDIGALTLGVDREIGKYGWDLKREYIDPDRPGSGNTDPAYHLFSVS